MLLRQFQLKLVHIASYRCLCTTATVKDAAASSATITAKEAYIKQMAANQTESIDKPENWDSAKPFKDIPGPKPLPIVGNLWRFLPKIGKYGNMDQISQHHSFIKEYGKIVKLSGLKVVNDIIILFEPNDIELMYRNEGVWPHREGLQTLIYYKLNIRQDVFQGQGGVLTGHGEDWYKARTVVNPPMMRPQSAQLYIGPMNNVAQDFMNRIRVLEKNDPNGDMPVDFSNELNKWALESICVIGLNKRLGLLDPNRPPSEEAQRFINDVLDIFHYLNELDVKPSLWRWISTPKWRRYIKTLDRVTEFQLKHINEAVKKFEESDYSSKPKSEMSILEQLILRDKKVAFAMVFDMLIAGIDTTSRTSAAALYFLSKNPIAQKKLQDECRKMLPNKDSPITKQILEQMPYLKAVIKETTRLAPIAIGNVRRTQKEMVLNGYQIPKGVDVLASHMYLSRQDKYFPQANEFIPERWLRDGGDKYQSEHAHPFVFMPFGFGPRSCIGRRLAQLEIEVLLAKIYRNFSSSWPHKDMEWIMTLLYGVGSPLKYRMKSLEN